MSDMKSIPVKIAIDEGHALFFGWDDQRKGLNYRHFGIVTLDGLQNQDQDSLDTVAVGEDCPEDAIVPRIQRLASSLGVTVSTENIDYVCDRLDSVSVR